MKFKTAKAIEEAAQQTNSVAGTGVGLGAGVGMGMMLPGMLKETFQGQTNNNSKETDAFDKIKKLKELLDAGAITQEEFTKKKAEWLNKI